MLQRSNDWFTARLGRFTASEIHKILGAKGLGLTGETYCFEKAVEIVYGKDEEDSFCSFDMQRGIDLEPVAFRKFSELMIMEFIEVKQTTFFPFGNDAGASPDGLIGDDACLEIKCPRPTKFFKIIATNKIDQEYIAQMQFQMLCTNSKRCHFFNYIIFNNQEMWHEIIVERDEEFINLIKSRLQEAIKIRNDFMQYLIENKQFETIII